MLPSSFTVGILVGQISILFLLYLFVRYLLIAPPDAPARPSPAPKPKLRNVHIHKKDIGEGVEWLNDITNQIVDAYRISLAALPSPSMPPMPSGDIIRIRIERWIDQHRNADLMDDIVVHEADLGAGAPRVDGIRVSPHVRGGTRAEFDISYTPSHPPSISVSTAMLLNLPVLRFGSLPVSLSVALSHVSGTLVFHIPSGTGPVTMHLSSSTPLQLSLSLSSLLGSRAKLADLPKLHELIESRVRSVLQERLGKNGEGWEFVLPGLGDGIGGVQGLVRTLGEEVLGGDIASS